MGEFTGYCYEDLEIGMAHETVHTITEDDIQRFRRSVWRLQSAAYG